MNTPKNFKKAFLVIAFCLLNTLSYGQTKEETISWLKEKLYQTHILYSPNLIKKYVSKTADAYYFFF
jgi:hypothetical protein